ncbi:hypothetical protein [uncultured Campylobacter sp.]|uniref:hypothetical protein n=1 Tax=uncultured Campylobacter sp. TaxID=218934 RepID=UPI002631BA99|nr:hypothetical protein [uncultured Campylobacter sp.]
MKKYKIWTFIFILLSFLAIFFVAIFNYIVDPHYQFRMAKIYGVYWADNGRMKGSGIVKNYKHNSLIVGSSMSKDFLYSDLERIFVNPLKMTFSGSRPHELNILINRSFKYNNLKNIMLDLHIDSLCSNKNEVIFDELQRDLYFDKNIYRYIFNVDVARSGFLNLYKNCKKNSSTLHCNIETAFFRLPKDDFCPTNSPACIIKYSLKRVLKYENIVENFTFNYLPIVEAHPETKFIFFYPPYAITEFKNWQEEGLIEQIEKIKLTIAEYTKKYKNVEIYDFSDAYSIVSNLNLHTDSMHYHPKVNSWMLWRIKEKDKRFLVNLDNYEKRLSEFRNFVKNFNLEKDLIDLKIDEFDPQS